ncbi:hypothetical protein [Marininema halotolerans]|uniref:Uncharacterized protein n=1 Tax=Marininema halotolerans TaxID=1155944 RepID=A0A1I6SJF4_9BACL|nr:hypothetical protein [Marininema halotolerans]SFS76898.1 hypothetical protein SAMN05444972_107128 [Marininema halotolerans]
MKDIMTNLPIFDGSKEAIIWFEKKYERYFILKYTGKIGGHIVYVCHLINDKKRYNQGLKKLHDVGIVNGLELATSYFILLIWEDGEVDMLY